VGAERNEKKKKRRREKNLVVWEKEEKGQGCGYHAREEAGKLVGGARAEKGQKKHQGLDHGEWCRVKSRSLEETRIAGGIQR